MPRLHQQTDHEEGLALRPPTAGRHVPSDADWLDRRSSLKRASVKQTMTVNAQLDTKKNSVASRTCVDLQPLGLGEARHFF